MSSAAAELIARSNRLGADPKNTNYAGGNTSAKGTETDPVTGDGRRAAVGQGLRRRPRHPDGGRSRRAAAGPDARPRRRLPGRRARGRDGRRVRLLPARQGRRGAVDRHRDARAGRRSARRPPAPRLRHRDRDRRRRRGADAARSSATRWSGCRGAGPASSSASTSPRSRRPTRRRSAASSAATASRPGATPRERVRGELAVDHPHRASATSRSTRKPSPFGPRADEATSRWPPARAPRAGRRARAAILRGVASQDRPMVGHFTDDRRGARLPGLAPSTRAWPRSAPAAPTTSCAPRSSRWCSTCRRARRWRRSIARLAELHEAYREDYQAYYDRHADRRTRRRSAAPTR